MKSQAGQEEEKICLMELVHVLKYFKWTNHMKEICACPMIGMTPRVKRP